MAQDTFILDWKKRKPKPIIDEKRILQEFLTGQKPKYKPQPKRK